MIKKLEVMDGDDGSAYRDVSIEQMYGPKHSSSEICSGQNMTLHKKMKFSINNFFSKTFRRPKKKKKRKKERKQKTCVCSYLTFPAKKY